MSSLANRLRCALSWHHVADLDPFTSPAQWLADVLPVPLEIVRFWLEDLATPSDKALERISEALDVSQEWLLTGDRSEPISLTEAKERAGVNHVVALA